MKTYKVKNYKGNLVESLSRFQKSHKGMKIVEAIEDEEELKIKAVEEDAWSSLKGKAEVESNMKKVLDAFKKIKWEAFDSNKDKIETDVWYLCVDTTKQVGGTGMIKFKEQSDIDKIDKNLEIIAKDVSH